MDKTTRNFLHNLHRRLIARERESFVDGLYVREDGGLYFEYQPGNMTRYELAIIPLGSGILVIALNFSSVIFLASPHFSPAPSYFAEKLANLSGGDAGAVCELLDLNGVWNYDGYSIGRACEVKDPWEDANNQENTRV